MSGTATILHGWPGLLIVFGLVTALFYALVKFHDDNDQGGTT